MDTISALLLVDDSTLEDPLRDSLGAIASLNHTIVRTIDEAWQCLAAGGHQILYVDVRTSGSAGFQWVAKTLRRHPDVCVLMGAADCTAKDAMAALQAGAHDFLIDPFDPDLVCAVFEKAVSFIKTRQMSGERDGAGKKTLITQDPELTRVLEIARKVAPSRAMVMISGESGTGKELLAKFIHAKSTRENEPYIAVNCAALPEQLAESELFGHEKGAFTGAISRKVGKFESAGNGTLVLDEITEMALPLQAKLLRALQEREIVRIGSNHPVPVNARVIAISNRNLKQAVASGAFREDLYYRLSVIPLTIPPLRERKSDIPLLANYFLMRFSTVNNSTMQRISDAAMECLINQAWPGNVRELENTIERGVLIGSGEQLQPDDLILESMLSAPMQKPSLAAGMTVREMEKELIFKTLSAVNDNRTHAAKMLGISIRTLRNKLNEYREEVGVTDESM